MLFKDVATRLGIEKYPLAFEEIFDKLPTDDGELYDVGKISALEEKYALFGEFYEAVINAANALREDSDKLAYARVIREYNKTADDDAMRAVPIPQTDTTVQGDLLPLLILIPEVERAASIYRSRGFSEEQIKKNLEIFKINMEVLELDRGRPLIDKGHYGWSCLYMRATIFDHKSFNFQLTKFGNRAVILKNKNDGHLAVVMRAGKYHENGLVFGSVGAEDEVGAYDAEFSETDEAYIGHGVTDGKIDREPTVFKKSEWECAIREGDDVVNLHIPRGSDLTPAIVRESIVEGFALAKKHYPERSPKYIVCNSWLLDDAIVEILGKESKLSKFIDLFLRYPTKTNGNEGRFYLFPGCHGAIEDYSEKTSFQRGVKKLMLSGGSLHAGCGVIDKIELL